MRKKISSALTVFYKNLWALLLIGLGVVLVVTDVPFAGKAIYFFSWSLGAMIFWGWFSDLRTVEMDVFFLYVSDGRRSAKIPFSEVRKISQDSVFSQDPVITIELLRKTEFGDRIRFMPYFVFGLFFQPHPVVGLLKQTAKLTVP